MKSHMVFIDLSLMEWQFQKLGWKRKKKEIKILDMNTGQYWNNTGMQETQCICSGIYFVIQKCSLINKQKRQPAEHKFLGFMVEMKCLKVWKQHILKREQ